MSFESDDVLFPPLDATKVEHVIIYAEPRPTWLDRLLYRLFGREPQGRVLASWKIGDGDMPSAPNGVTMHIESNGTFRLDD